MQGNEQLGSLLISEDEFSTLEVLMMIAAGIGIEKVLTTCDSSIALEKGRVEKPDLVLMDITYPRGPSGLDIVSAWQNEAHLSGWRPFVVFISAQTDRHTKGLAMGLDPLAFVEKPFHKEQIKSTLRVAYQERAFIVARSRRIELIKRELLGTLQPSESEELIRLERFVQEGVAKKTTKDTEKLDSLDRRLKELLKAKQQ